MNETETRAKIYAKINELQSQIPKAREEDDNAENSGSMFQYSGRVRDIQNQINELRKLL